MENKALKTVISSLFALACSGAAMASTDITQTLRDSIFVYSEDTQTTSNLLGSGSSKLALQSAGSTGSNGVENIGYAVSVLQQLQVETELTPETTDLFGEQIDIGTGGLTFVQTDLSIPGNSGLAVSIRRKLLDPKDRYNGTREFGLWSLDLPHISTSLVKARSATSDFSGAWGEGKACSGRLLPAYYSPQGYITNVSSHEYWNGDSIYIPGRGNSPLISNNGSNDRQTKENWKVSCFTTSEGYDGFVVTTDDGTKYTFGQMRLIPGIELTKPLPWTPSSPSPAPEFDRKGKCISQCEEYDIYHGFMLVTRIEDRFGNYVNYNYTNHTVSGESRKLLSSVSANDGRSVTINYVNDDVIIDNIVTNGRIWRYNYNENISNPQVDYLTSITLPDLRKWTFSGYSAMYTTEGIPSDFFENPQDPALFCVVNPRATTLTMTHPDGLTGTFTTKNSVQGRTEVPKIPLGTVLPNGTINTYSVKRCYSSLSITSKTLTHPSGETDTWLYSYSENPGSFEDQGEPGYIYDDKTPITGVYNLGLPAVTEAANGFELADLKSTTVTAPDNSKTVHYFVRRYDWLEGAEVFTDYYDTDGTTLLKRIQKNYQKGQPKGDYSLQSYASGNEETRLSRQLLNKQVTFQEGNTYTTTYSDFNAYEIARKVSESNNIAGMSARYTKQEYRHDTTHWVLNQPTKVLVSHVDNNYTVVSETTYHTSSTAGGAYQDLNLPYESKRYGTWVSRNVSYHGTGQVKKTEFNQLLKKAGGSNGSQYRYRDIISYHRGQPTEIRYGARYSDSATVTQRQTVDNNGWVTSITDLNNVVTRYGYTQSGRLRYVDSPDDSHNWLDTWFTWSHNTDGSLKRTLQRCTLNSAKSACSGVKFTIKTDYDGLLRGVLTQSTDNVNNINRYQAHTFNAWNKPTYQSYPATSQSGTTNSGTWSTYDGLQRLATQTVTGGGTTYQEYLSGNRLKVTNARNNDTITTWQAFGSPAFERPQLIISDVSSGKAVHTQMDINVFGDITQITQSDGGNTEKHIEYRAYDNLHNLCKISRGDTGITVFTHNNLGELINKAEGVEQGSTGSNTNCNSNKSSADTITFTQDNLGDTWKVNYPDAASPDLTYTRDNNGNITKLQAGANRTDYLFNSLNMVEKETLVIDGKSLVLDYTYNTLGAIDNLKYPNNDIVYFAPNNFGEPTKAGKSGHNYASNATYYPNGMVDSFSYGNGLTHKTTLNSRQLPQSIRDNRSGLTALHYSYTYDNNLNVKSLTDHTNTSYSLTNLVYDGLDRLTNVSGNSGIGNSAMTYDALGNIKTYSSKGHNLTYTYNYTPNSSSWGDSATNRLRKVQDSTGNKDYPFFTYDDRGNTTATSFNHLTFNRANQLTSANGDNSYIYDGHGRRIKQTDSEGTSYSMYSLDGTLMYRENQHGGINYIYLGKKLIAKDGFIPESSGKQHYRPYGHSIEGATDDIGYTGHKFDKDLGLSYMQARYYDPVIGRFYSNDPIGFRDVHSFNRYAYANNNPYKYVDPDGEQAVTFVGTVFTADAATPDPSDAAVVPKAVGYAAAFALAAGIDAVFNESKEGSSNGVTIDDDGSGVVEITVETDKGDISIIGEPTVDGDTLTIGGDNGAHIDGPGGGSVGLSGVKEAGRKIGKEYGVSEVVIEGGTRTTGANPGKKPRPIRIKVDNE